jgi:hypothetical protein
LIGKVIIDTMRNHPSGRQVLEVVIINVLNVRAITTTPTMQMTKVLFLLGVDAKVGNPTAPRQVPQRVDLAKLIVTFPRVAVAGYQFFAQSP